MPVRIIRIVLVAIAALAVAAAFAYQYGLFAPERGRIGTAKIGGAFALTDQTGQIRRDTDFRGKMMLVFFGYTFCPDVCPTALQIMALALDTLGDKARDIQPIFITIDPERDTVGHLGPYAANFHPRLVALTGSKQAIASAAHVYRVYYAKAKGQDSGSDYLMDHTSIVYLMGRDGRYLAHFTHNTSAEAMARGIRKHF